MSDLPGFLGFLAARPQEAIFFLIGIIIAVTVHEFAHAWAAARQGDLTAKYLGRLNLNPLSHLDPAGSVLFLLAGFGWGKPVPVNPANLRDGKRGDFYVSIAGIVTNLIVAFIFLLPFQLLQLTGGGISNADLTAGTNVWLQFCSAVAYVNILLAAFNLLPIPPLDGSKAIGILVPRRYEEQYQRFLEVGPVLLIVLLLSAFLTDFDALGFILDPLIAAFRWLVFLPSSL